MALECISHGMELHSRITDPSDKHLTLYNKHIPTAFWLQKS